MTEAEDFHARVEALRAQLRAVHGIKGRDLAQAVKRSRRFVPRWARRMMLQLAAAEPLIGHPKLERQVDFAALKAAHEKVKAHLDTVDVADIRRGRFLAMAGLLSFNVIAVAVLFVLWMVWSGQL